MKKEDYLTDEDVAEILRLEVSTVKKNRRIGKNHPPFIKIGARILYPRDQFEKWLKQKTVIQEIKAS